MPRGAEHAPGDAEEGEKTAQFVAAEIGERLTGQVPEELQAVHAAQAARGARVTTHLHDGARLAAGSAVLTIAGPLRQILAEEAPLLNWLEGKANKLYARKQRYGDAL